MLKQISSWSAIFTQSLVVLWPLHNLPVFWDEKLKGVLFVYLSNKFTAGFRRSFKTNVSSPSQTKLVSALKEKGGITKTRCHCVPILLCSNLNIILDLQEKLKSRFHTVLSLCCNRDRFMWRAFHFSISDTIFIITSPLNTGDFALKTISQEDWFCSPEYVSLCLIAT